MKVKCLKVLLPSVFQNLPGVFSAREFVWWYNGHPDYASLPVDLSRASTAVILGQVRTAKATR